MANDTRFQPVFEQLKAILQPLEPQLQLQADEPGNYYLNTPYSYRNKALFFGAVQIKKNYVSYHLMPLYMFPALLDELSPALKKRMQGKSCFNFTSVDQPLLDELAQLTERGLEQVRREYQPDA